MTVFTHIHFKDMRTIVLFIYPNIGQSLLPATHLLKRILKSAILSATLYKPKWFHDIHRYSFPHA